MVELADTVALEASALMHESSNLSLATIIPQRKRGFPDTDRINKAEKPSYSLLAPKLINVV